MRKVSLYELIKALNPKVIQGQSPQPFRDFEGIGTDTRKDLSSQLFWALKGESYDAHEFLRQAVEKGATGLVVQSLPQDFSSWRNRVIAIQVPDTLKALQIFSRFIRHQAHCKVIGITGSNGKTSTKEFLAEILREKFRIHWNKGSFNNHFGLPFNLLGIPDGTEVVIAEMGMNHSGELKELCEIAEPDVVVCTTVGRAHIEHFGSQEKIAEAKEEIYKFSPPSAMRIFNLDDPWVRLMMSAKYSQAKKILTFSNQDMGADVCIKLKTSTAQGLSIEGTIAGVEGSSFVKVIGDHQITNLAAASSLAVGVGMSGQEIWQALPRCHGAWGRMQSLKSRQGVSLLFDGYNANPDSMAALLASTKHLMGRARTYAVLAEMKELGTHAESAHEELGQKAAEMGFAKVWFYGPSAAAFERGYLKSGSLKNLLISDSYKDSLASEMASVLNPEDLVVIKGSRGMKTERFVLACDPLDFSADKKE